jgi:hypothetical protein
MTQCVIMRSLFGIFVLFTIGITALATSAFSAEVEMKAITFKALGRNFEGHLILPKGTHVLNLLAKKADQELEKLPIIFSPQFLKAAGGKGAYSIRDHLLFIPSSAVEAEGPDPVVLHELIHARIWVALRKGTPLTFNGLAYNDLPQVQNHPYGPGFGIDEVVATFFSVRYHANAMRSALQQHVDGSSNAASASIMDSMTEVRVYVSRLITMLTTLGFGLEQTTHPGPVSTPADLAFLPKISWQEAASEKIRIYFPVESSNSMLTQVKTFAKNLVPLLRQLDSAGAKLQLLDSPTDEQLRSESERFLGMAQMAIDSFFETFPDEAEIIRKADNIQ